MVINTMVEGFSELSTHYLIGMIVCRVYEFSES